VHYIDTSVSKQGVLVFFLYITWSYINIHHEGVCDFPDKNSGLQFIHDKAHEEPW